MDFESTIMHAVKKNGESAKKEVKYYSTKYEPPKKLEKSKTLSANIQKFLARQKEEEKQKALEAKKRMDKLLALRSQDKKASRRVNVMLKRTKSANQSVLQEAVDKDNTAITLAGSSQPDEDDYGYVSQNASEFYDKLMEKYNSMPEEPKFSFDKKRPKGNLNSAKERVKAALNQSEMHQHNGTKGPRKRKSNAPHEEYDPYEPEEKKNPKPKLKPAPVINFNDLLKIAEKKQFEPVVIETKKEIEERLLTKKEKLERERDREQREQREKRDKERLLIASGKLPRPTSDAQQPKAKSPIPQTPQTSKKKEEPINRSKTNTKCDISNIKKEISNVNHRQQQQQDVVRPIKRDNKGAIETKTIDNTKTNIITKSKDIRNSKPKQFPPRDLIKQKLAPPPSGPGRPLHRKKPLISKGRFYDPEDDEDYDSEMDDFIDDGPEEGDDYSKYISEIFGYDKKKYRHLDDDDDRMESSFAEQMREETISTKIGIMEDLEEQRKEEEHNKRKAMIKKMNKL